jgi:hypothetical protein
MKFESALKIVYTFQGATRSTVIQRWFAPGVGLVREITSQNQTIELQKYQLASENPAR